MCTSQMSPCAGDVLRDGPQGVLNSVRGPCRGRARRCVAGRIRRSRAGASLRRAATAWAAGQFHCEATEGGLAKRGRCPVESKLSGQQIVLSTKVTHIHQPTPVFRKNVVRSKNDGETRYDAVQEVVHVLDLRHLEGGEWVGAVDGAVERLRTS